MGTTRTGGYETSLKAARLVNEDMAAAQTTWPDRIRWFCSIPWEHEDLALRELERATAEHIQPVGSQRQPLAAGRDALGDIELDHDAL